MKIATRLLGKILFVMMLAALVITSVIGSVSAQEEPPCKDGGLLFYNYVPSATFAHVAPCGYLVKFAEAGKWKLTGSVPLVTPKAFHYPACKVTAAGRIKAKPGCAVVVRADPAHVEDGTIWRFTLTQVVAQP